MEHTRFSHSTYHQFLQYTNQQNVLLFNLQTLFGFPSWVVHLSYERLIKPTNQFLTVIKGLEEEFNNYMFEGLTNSKKITQKLFKKIKFKYQNVDDIIIRTFVRQRLYIRMKHLNYKRNEQNNCKLLKYKVSSARNKMKKFLTQDRVYYFIFHFSIIA
jgi:hypothetical protein